MKGLALFRFKLLIKQKLGWGIVAAATLFFPFALFLAFSSYIRPDKIYWDLSLSFCFLLSILLSTYLGTHLFQEESQRKTLSFVLTLTPSRKDWLYGNWMGIVAMLGFSLSLWTLLLSLGSLAASTHLPPFILFQAQLLVFLESAVILALSFFLSLYLKPILSWLAVLALIALLHSKTYLEILIVEADFSGPTKFIYDSVLFVLNFLPPLEWWDIRVFVGFHDALNFEQFFLVFALTMAWTYVFLFLSQRKLEKMDL